VPEALVAQPGGLEDGSGLRGQDRADGVPEVAQRVLWGFLRTARAALPHLAQGTAARIVAVSSFVAHVFRTDVTTFPASAAAKAGMEALVRALAVEAAKSGITVNAVSPGYTRKDPGAHAALAQHGTRWRRIPLGRIGTRTRSRGRLPGLTRRRLRHGQVIHVNGGLV
jgi:NAD(P)-dependent dehydrogenase (short-subunit alcohol dehydrogenase family)